MAATKLYGHVTRFPKTDFEMKWETEGHPGDNPEGKFRYTFCNVDEAGRGGWTVMVFTRLDADFFKSRPHDYKFEPVSGRPENMRPVRPSNDLLAKFDEPKMPVVSEMPAIPVEMPPVEPKKRMGRPPKAEAQLGA